MSTLRSHVKGCCRGMHRVGREHGAGVGLMEELLLVLMQADARQSGHRRRRGLEAKVAVHVRTHAALMPLHLHPGGGVFGGVGRHDGCIGLCSVSQLLAQWHPTTVMFETWHGIVQILSRWCRRDWPRIGGTKVARWRR